MLDLQNSQTLLPFHIFYDIHFQFVGCERPVLFFAFYYKDGMMINKTVKKKDLSVIKDTL